jgi:hypothetical protein
MLLPALNGTEGITQIADPCARPELTPLVHATCTVPDPPETTPLIEIGDVVDMLGGIIIARTKGLAGLGGCAFAIPLIRMPARSKNHFFTHIHRKSTENFPRNTHTYSIEV